MRQLTQTLLDTGLSNAAVACLIALVAVAVTRFSRRPALAYALWLLVLLKFLSPAVIELAVSKVRVVDATAQDSVSGAPAHLRRPPSDDLRGVPREVAQKNDSAEQNPTLIEPADDPEAVTSELAVEEAIARPLAAITAGAISSAAPVALVSWVCGTLLFFAMLAARVGQFRQVLQRTTIAPQVLQAEAIRLSKFLGIRRAPEVRIVDATIPPFLFAARLQPVIVLPRQLIEHLSYDEWKMVLAHELAHLKRKDHYLLWLELVVVGLYWWQPVAWLARRQLQRASEQCCDAFVIRNFPRQARDYATALLKAVDFLESAPPFRPGLGLAFARSGPMQRRFEMILRPDLNDRLPRGTILFVISLGAVALPISIHSLWAGSSPSGDAEQAKSACRGESAQATPEKPATDGQASIDRRLHRLEKLVESLTTELKSQRANSATDPEPSTTSPKLVIARQNAIEMEQRLEKYARFASAIREVQRRVALFESSGNRREGARKNLEAANRAYLDGKATLDLLLDAQRRAVDSETSWARLALDLSDLDRDELERVYSEVYLGALIHGRDMALETYHRVRKQQELGVAGSETEKEAQAREQYFSFRNQVETALNYHLRLQNGSKSESFKQ